MSSSRAASAGRSSRRSSSRVVVIEGGIARKPQNAAEPALPSGQMSEIAAAPPRYLRRCPSCGELRNRARRILCACDRLVCAVCGEGGIRRPISDHYDETDGKLWHTPWLAGLRPCPSCGAPYHRAWSRA